MCARTPEDILPTERSEVSEECGCERGPFKQPLKSVFASILMVAHYIQVLLFRLVLIQRGEKSSEFGAIKTGPESAD